MPIQLPARVRALEAQHPGLIPAIGVGATIVAAYAGIAALRRGSSPAAGPAAFPGLNDLSSSGLGLDSGVPPVSGVGAPSVGISPGGGGYDPISPVVNTGLRGVPTNPAIGTGTGTGGTGTRTLLSRTGPAPATTIGGSRGAPAPTRVNAPTTSHLAARPGTPTPAGHVAVIHAAAGAGPKSIAYKAAGSPVAPTTGTPTPRGRHGAGKPGGPTLEQLRHHPLTSAPSYSAHRSIAQ